MEPISALPIFFGRFPTASGREPGYPISHFIVFKLENPLYLEYNHFASIAVAGFINNHGLAIRTDGSLATWSNNKYGESTPQSGTDFTVVSADNSHSLALRADNTLLAWGDNRYGECDIPPIKGTIIALAAGFGFSVTLVEVSIEAMPPIADAGENIVAHANEEVLLDASASYDPDGDIIEYTWKRLPDGQILYSGPDVVYTTRALGRVQEVIELTVTDDQQVKASCTIIIINATIDALQKTLNTVQE